MENSVAGDVVVTVMVKVMLSAELVVVTEACIAVADAIGKTGITVV